MKVYAESTATGRGAQKRQETRRQKEHAEALAWWRRPGVLVFSAALALALLGWGVVVRESHRVPVREATLDGLHVRLEQARWILDQMDHGENFQKPSVMMPDMPEWGNQRVSLDLTFQNRSDEARTYDGSEFLLVPEIGDPVPPIGAQVGRARVGPGQNFNTALFFDFDTTHPHGKLRVKWQRGEERVYLPIPEPAEHYHLRPRGGEVALPPEARLVIPLGRSERGARLFNGVYGCIACHGDPQIPGSNNVGPHLGGVATAARHRREGMSAAQYLYESIIEPGAFIAPECKGGRPCAEPTAMPEYASLMKLQDLADVLVYLMELEAPEAPEAVLNPEALEAP
jgi:mono/diheme cytochrome c family protein